MKNYKYLVFILFLFQGLYCLSQEFNYSFEVKSGNKTGKAHVMLNTSRPINNLLQ